MKITKAELSQLIEETLKEFADMPAMPPQEMPQAAPQPSIKNNVTAKRNIVHAARKASMDFENEIRKDLGIPVPDEMPPHLLKKYLQVAQEMENDILVSVAEAVKKLEKVRWPSNQDGGQNG